MDDRGPPDGHEQRVAIIDELTAGFINAREAAEKLADLTLKGDPEMTLGQLWASVTLLAHDRAGQLEDLADMLVEMAGLPDATEGNGHTLVVYDGKVWSDLPMLGWEFNDEWNSLNVPREEPKRTEVIQKFKNVNTLAALLMRSGKEAFHYEVFATSTMSEALETTAQLETTASPEAFIPAAATWIAVLGRQMYQWDGNLGDPGSGGPLWQGQPGPCEERWKFWKKRFVEISESNDISQEARKAATEAAITMHEIDSH